MSIADELEKLNKLLREGTLSQEEFATAKKALLNDAEQGASSSSALKTISTDVNSWSMFIHLSQFCAYLVPIAGIVVPIVLWQIKKDESPIIDEHGRNVTNWIITEIIYGVLFGILCFVFIGIPLLVVLGILAIVFPIIGAIKANEGEVWNYPGSIKFF